MKTQQPYSYLTLALLMGFWSCSSSLQTAKNAGEVDDLYGNSGNAAVYASNSSDYGSVASSDAPSQRYSRQQQRSLRNANPDFNDEQYAANGGANTDEYYTELSARKLNRGLSADPGWNDDGTNAYNSGFMNGYNSATTSAYSWNRWGYNNTGFYNGLGLGLGMRMGMGGYGFGNPYGSPFGYGYGSPFGYDNFYSPFGYNSFYSPFNSYALGGFGGYYSPFYGNYFGGGYGGYYGNTYVNNNYVTGADPYRASNRTYGARAGGATNRYNDAFVNTPRSSNGGRTAGTPAYTGNASSGNTSSGYYSSPRSNSRGGSSYYYDNSNGSSRGGRSANTPAPSYNSSTPSSGRSSSSDYYAAPRQNSRGSYSSPSNAGSYNGGRGSASQPNYQSAQPTYSAPQQQSQPTYSAPQRSYSAPSAPSGGGGYSSGGGGGGSRGPR